MFITIHTIFKYVNKMNCRECESDDIIETNGSMVCRNCGLVLEKSLNYVESYANPRHRKPFYTYLRSHRFLKLLRFYKFSLDEIEVLLTAFLKTENLWNIYGRNFTRKYFLNLNFSP